MNPSLLQHSSRAAVPAAAEAIDDHDFAFARALMSRRQNVSPKRLVEPGPSAQQLDDMLTMAGTAPDHGQLTPWRFVIVPAEKRTMLAEVFALALIDRDPGATLEQIEAAREKAHRAPLLVLAIARVGPVEPPIPVFERLVSLGAAVQNLLLSAQAMDFGSGLTSGQAMTSPRMRALFALADGDEPVCFVNVGTVAKAKPPRIRPSAVAYTSSL